MAISRLPFHALNWSSVTAWSVGSDAGTTRTLSTVGAYSVTEVAVLGYHLASASADCSGTIALGEQKTCVLTNDDNAP